MLVQDAAAAAKEKAIKLQAQAQEADRTSRLWEDLSKYVNGGWNWHIKHLFEKEPALLELMRVDEHPAIAGLEEIYHQAAAQARADQRQFPSNLEKACDVASLPLDRSSRHPKYTFADGYFRLEVNDRKGTARLAGNEGRLEELSADVEAVVDVVKREYQRLFDRAFDGRTFWYQLRDHYTAIIKKESKRDGEGVPIRQVTRRMGKSVKGFRTDEFLVDLSRLIAEGPLTVDAVQLDLQQTKDTSQGVFLPGAAGRGGYIGFLLFRKV